MNNNDLAGVLEEAVSMMEILDTNVFKVNAYRKLAREVEELDRPLSQWSGEEIRGRFTGSMAGVISEYLERESFAELDSLRARIPAGVCQMLKISGVGPKKVRTLWKEAGIETLKGLKQACEAGTVALLKGFGEKIQASVLSGIAFLEEADGCLLMHQATRLASEWEAEWKVLGLSGSQRAGDLVTRHEVVRQMQFWIPEEGKAHLLGWFGSGQWSEADPAFSGPFHQTRRHLPSGCQACFYFGTENEAPRLRFVLCSGPGHWKKAHEAGIPLYRVWRDGGWTDETSLYARLGRPFVPEELRTGNFEWDDHAGTRFGQLLRYEDLKGCIHNHSRYSDGKNTLEEMAKACLERGWSYFGIADHSQTATYANGLNEERVNNQWKEIEQLNASLAPFRILKGIESDILGDGSLDYPDDVLSGFDYVVASVHSGLKMDKETATRRLIRAIEHPATRILGHCSGRLLLRRPGYPLDYSRILDACLANGVAIELNSHPARLDMDWHHLCGALEKGILISINPDAHSREEMDLMQYGVWLARKAGATAAQVLNARSTEGILQFFKTGK